MKLVLPWCGGLATFLLLTVVCLWDYYPPIAGPQPLGVTFPSPLPVGTSEPLIVTGQPGAADYFFVHYVDARTVTFANDSWGHGGPTSPPVTVTPGQPHVLEIQLPALAAIPGSPDQPSDHLRVTFDGTPVLEAKVTFFSRRPLQAFFARNPLGGTSCGPEFTGQLRRADGRPLLGNTRAYFTRTERFRGWLWFGRWQLLTSLLLGAAVTWTLRRLLLSPSPLLPLSPFPLLPSLRAHRPFFLTAALCSIAFTAMLTSGTFRLIYPETFGNFYDFQALSLLQGRLDVPEEALQEEAFVYAGKIYGYFGVTPALLRLPFVIFGLAFGELSRAAMLLYYAATLVGAYLLLLDACRLLRPDRPRPAAWQSVLFTAHVGLGSTIFFLGSRAYIYHEAILCGIMFALFSCWCSLRHLARPAGRWWLGALALGTLSVHARPPTGLFALTVLGCVAASQLFRLTRSPSPRLPLSSSPPLPRSPSPRLPLSPSPFRPLAIGALSVFGVLSFNALSYAKFRTIDGCPLRLNVQYTEDRLAKIDGQQFHAANIPYGFSSYLLHPNVEITRHFPWLYIGPAVQRRDFPQAKIDFPDRALALPLGMTGLFVLATVACAATAVKPSAARAPILVLWAAIVPCALAMFAAIATSERYTGDFCPFLFCAAAFGLAAPCWRSLTTAALAAATLWACVLTCAVTIHYQGAMVWGVPADVTQRYQQLRQRVDNFFHVRPTLAP